MMSNFQQKLEKFEAKQRREEILLVQGRRLIDLMNREDLTQVKHFSKCLTFPFQDIPYSIKYINSV
jgi:hypothetical protein